MTELLGTDLHRLLTSRPLEKQFIQYFLYQILVRHITLLVYPVLSLSALGGRNVMCDRILMLTDTFVAFSAG